VEAIGGSSARPCLTGPQAKLCLRLRVPKPPPARVVIERVRVDDPRGWIVPRRR
jgi:hypothetical protein